MKSYTNSFRLGVESLEEEYTAVPPETEKQFMFCLSLIYIHANAFILNAAWFKIESCLKLQLEL